MKARDMRRLKPKSFVLAKYPKATAKQWSHAWCIEARWPLHSSDLPPLGSGHTELDAWKDAARKL